MAYKRILFGTDGTPRAAASGHVATELAKAGKAELIVAHVWERPEGARKVLDAAVTAAQEAGVKKIKGELHGGGHDIGPAPHHGDGDTVAGEGLRRGGLRQERRNGIRSKASRRWIIECLRVTKRVCYSYNTDGLRGLALLHRQSEHQLAHKPRRRRAVREDGVVDSVLRSNFAPQRRFGFLAHRHMLLVAREIAEQLRRREAARGPISPPPRAPAGTRLASSGPSPGRASCPRSGCRCRASVLVIDRSRILSTVSLNSGSPPR